MAIYCPTYARYLVRSAAYFSPSQDWTRLVWVKYDNPVPVTDYLTVWIMGAVAEDFIVTPWLWSGNNNNTTNSYLSVNPGSGEVDLVDHATGAAGTWFHFGVQYTAVTHTIGYFINGVSQATGTADLSGVSPLAEERMGSDVTHVAGHTSGITLEQVGTWQGILTPAQIVAQMTMQSAVTQSNLLSFNTLFTAGASDLGTWTLVGSPSVVSGPTPTGAFTTSLTACPVLSTTKQWRLHRFDTKPRAEERA